MPKNDSPYLQHLIEELAVATTTEENDQIWQRVETPIIEDVPNKSEQCLVTFLYREESDKKTIYLWATFTGLPCSLQSQFKVIPNTDIRYLTLILPRTFRSAYNLLIVDEDTTKVELPEQENTTGFYPIPTGKFKESQMLLMRGQSGYVCKWVTSLLKHACNPCQIRATAFFHRNNLSIKIYPIMQQILTPRL